MDFRKKAYILWLCLPVGDREPETVTDLASQLGVKVSELNKWRAEPEFLAEWEAQYRRTVGSPERAQAIMETLFRTATDPDDPKHVQAGKQYLEAIDAIRPQSLNITINRPASELSDEELSAILAEKAAHEKNLRAS